MTTSDTDSDPCRRDEPCANCGKTWSNHSSWSCKDASDSRWFIHRGFKSKLSINQRYLTSDMPEFYQPGTQKTISQGDETPTIPTIKAARPAPEDKSDDWRAWAHNKSGDCPCGIKKEVCKYHQDTSKTQENNWRFFG